MLATAKALRFEFSLDQRIWVCKAVKNTTGWDSLAKDYNQSFKVNVSSNDLESLYVDTTAGLNPCLELEERPLWAQPVGADILGSFISGQSKPLHWNEHADVQDFLLGFFKSNSEQVIYSELQHRIRTEFQLSCSVKQVK